MPPSSMTPGTVLGGRYRLEDLLSEHAGARFWRATDTVLARSVAVHAVVSDDPRAEAMLEAARRSVRVTDPHFLRVLDCDDADGVTWVINEWGDGESLDVMLGQGPLPPARAAWLAREVAEAVVAAHAEDLPHGRLNPESVMVTRAGAVKVVGFVVYAAIAGPRPVDPAYGPVSEAEADVIDVAGILYAALTGRWPGLAPSHLPPAPREGLRTLRPRQVRAGVPRTLDAICERVLTKEASQHVAPIETAHEIAAALSDYVGDPAVAAPMDLPSMHDDPTVGTPVPPVLPPAVPPAGSAVPPAAPEAAPEPEAEPEAEPEPAPEPALEAELEPGAPDAETEAAPRLPATGDPEATMAAPPPLDDTMPRVFAGAPPASLAGDRPAPVEHAPPPPPLEETPARPLFADHERRVPENAAGPTTEQRPSGFWPFEDDAAGPNEAPRRHRGRIVLGVLVLALLLAAMYAAFSLGKGDDKTPGAASQPTPTTTAEPPTGTPYSIVGAHDFDPEGDPPTENPEQARLAVDGNPATGWQTQRYLDDPRLGGIKSGVGLILDLGAQRTVGSVELRLKGTPTGFEVYTTPPGVDDLPVNLSDTRRLTGMSASVENPVVRFDPAVQTRYVVIWLTRLPAVPGGFRGEIDEVMVRP